MSVYIEVSLPLSSSTHIFISEEEERYVTEVLTSKHKTSVSVFGAFRPPFTLVLSTMKHNPIKLSIVQYTTPIHTIYTISSFIHYATTTSPYEYIVRTRNLSMRRGQEGKERSEEVKEIQETERGAGRVKTVCGPAEVGEERRGGSASGRRARERVVEKGEGARRGEGQGSASDSPRLLCMRILRCFLLGVSGSVGP
jgi:hypothetical protein